MMLPETTLHFFKFKHSFVGILLVLLLLVSFILVSKSFKFLGAPSVFRVFQKKLMCAIFLFNFTFCEQIMDYDMLEVLHPN